MAIKRPDITGSMKAALWGEKWFDTSLYLLFAVLFLSPFLDSVPLRMLISTLASSLLMVAGVMSLSGHRTLCFFGGMTACIALSLRWTMYFFPTPTISKLGTLAMLVFVIMLNAVALTKVFSEGRVTVHRVKGAVACYMLFGISWALLYSFLDQVIPNAFSLPPGEGGFGTIRQEMLTYFSFVTLTTVGYGDVTPTHEITRMFAVMEALCGQLYPATLLARLVSLQLLSKDDEGNADPSPHEGG